MICTSFQSSKMSVHGSVHILLVDIDVARLLIVNEVDWTAKDGPANT